MTTKDIEYYMSLPYTIQVECIKDPVDYYFIAGVLEIDGLIAYGETGDEARQALQGAMRRYFETRLERGLPIPEPFTKE